VDSEDVKSELVSSGKHRCEFRGCEIRACITSTGADSEGVKLYLVSSGKHRCGSRGLRIRACIIRGVQIWIRGCEIRACVIREA